MILICRADKFVIGRSHQIPDPFNLTCNVVYVLLRRNSGFCRLQFDLLTMLIRARLEKYIVSLRALESCDTVCKNRLIRIADVRLTRCIGDRGRHIILWFAHTVLLLILFSCIAYFLPQIHIAEQSDIVSLRILILWHRSIKNTFLLP